MMSQWLRRASWVPILASMVGCSGSATGPAPAPNVTLRAPSLLQQLGHPSSARRALARLEAAPELVRTTPGIASALTGLCRHDAPSPSGARAAGVAARGAGSAHPCVASAWRAMARDGRPVALVEVARSVTRRPSADHFEPVVAAFVRLRARDLSLEQRVALRGALRAAAGAHRRAITKAPSRPSRLERELLGLLRHAVHDPRDRQALDDERFWQGAAAEALVQARTPTIARALLRGLATPSKRAFHGDLLAAYVALGADGVRPATRLLDGRDTALVRFAERQALAAYLRGAPAVSDAHQAVARRAHRAVALGALRALPEGAPVWLPLLEAKDVRLRAMVIESLWAAPSPPSVAMLRDHQLLGKNVGTRDAAALCNVAPRLLDAALAEPLEALAATLQGDAPRAALLCRTAALVSADDTSSPPHATVARLHAELVVERKRCPAGNAACALAPQPGGKSPAAIAMVAALARLGRSPQKGEARKLAAALPHVRHAAALAVWKAALERALPDGDPEVERTLRAWGEWGDGPAPGARLDASQRHAALVTAARLARRRASKKAELATR